MRRWTVVALAFGVGCSGGEVHECDAGTPTCESTLLILLPDPRTDFNLTVSDGEDLDLEVRCPLQEGAEDSGSSGPYTLFCGAGRLQIDTYLSFGDQVQVQLEQAEARDFEPRYSKGADYCGNPCTQGTIQL
jgi:hypothetical protein